jgi:hypothetical protein
MTTATKGDVPALIARHRGKQRQPDGVGPQDEAHARMNQVVGKEDHQRDTDTYRQILRMLDPQHGMRIQ